MMKTEHEELKRTRGRPPVGAFPITVRLPPHELGMLDRWIELSGTAVSRPEAMRRMLHLVVDGPRRWRSTTYGAPHADAKARLVSFWVENDGERFSVEIDWPTIDALARIRSTENWEQWTLDTAEDYVHFCEQWQSQLVASAITRFRAVNTISLDATDLSNIIEY